MCEVGETVEKELEETWMRMEDVTLLLTVLEERKKKRKVKVDEVKGGYQTTHREFVKRIKENQWKLEEAMTLLAVEALGLSLLRFMKELTEAEADKLYPMKPKVHSTFPADGIQQENRRAEEGSRWVFGHNFRRKCRWSWER